MRKIWIISLLSLLPFYSASAAAKAPRVLMMVSEGFYAPEHYKPREIFENEGFSITVAAKRTGPIPPDVRNTEFKPVNADVTFDKVNLKDFDAIVFAGGNGAWEDFFPNDTVHKLLSDAFKRSMTIGLICSSTGLLGVANNYDGNGDPIAEGRHVTGYFRVEGLLRNLGKVNYDPGDKDQPYVVVDGNLTTGRDPASSELFGMTMVEEIKKRFVSGLN